MKQQLFLLVLMLALISCQKENAIGSLSANFILPDISPEHTFSTVNYLPGQTKTVAERIRNFGGETTAPVVYYVQKMIPNINVTFDSLLTGNIIIGPNMYPVNNTNWIMTEQATRYKFTLKQNLVLTTDETSIIALNFTATGFPGSTSNWTTQVVSGTGGGETPTNNNLKSTRLYIQ